MKKPAHKLRNAITGTAVALGLLLTACGGGDSSAVNGKNGLNGIDGKPGIDGNPGAAGKDGSDGSAILSAELAPGEFLQLEHGLAGKNFLYDAQFEKNGIVYNHDQYSSLFPSEYAPPIAVVPASLEAYSHVVATTLSDKNIAIAYIRGSELLLKIVDATGTEVVPEILVSSAAQGAQVNLSAFDSGNMLVTYLTDNGYRYYQRYTNTLATVSGPLQVIPTYTSDALRSVTLADDRFVLAYTENDSTLTEVLHLAFYDASGKDESTQTLTTAEHFAQCTQLKRLPNGNLAVLYHDNDSGSDIVNYEIFDPTGKSLSKTKISDDYCIDSALAIAPNGNALVAFEYGGPDAPGYAVVDANGSLVSPPRFLTFVEQDAIYAGTYADGSFFVMVGEDDSNVGRKFTIGNDGTMLHEPGYATGYIPPNDRLRGVVTLDDNTVGVFEASYHDTQPIFMTRYSKGFLQLKKENDKEVRLYNFSPETLSATVAAHATP